MNQLQMLKMALIAYVNSAKAIWSAIAHPLSTISKKATMLKSYRIYGNSVQDGEPTPDNPIEVQSVGELTTKNLFGYIKGRVENGTILEELPTGVIVKGNLGAGGNAWSSGWFIPGAGATDGDNYAICPKLRTGDTVTVSADITLMELGMEDVYKPNIYLQTRDKNGGYTGVLGVVCHLNETKRIERKFTIAEASDGKTFYPVITLNSNVVKIENIQIEYGDTATEYEPYHKYKVPVTARGKNLWDKTNHIVSNSSNLILRSHLPAESYSWIKSGKTFTVSVTGFISENDTRTAPRLTVNVMCTDGTTLVSNTKVYGVKNEEKRVNVTTYIPQTEKEIREVIILFMNYSDNPNGVFDAYAKDIQIELGNTATSFEPYIEPQTHNIYLDEPLRKVGEYADVVDFEKGAVVRNVKNKIFTGDENFGAVGQSSTSKLYRYAIEMTDMPNLYSDYILVSNYFLTGNNRVLDNSSVPSVGIFSTSRIAFSTAIATKAEFQNWVKDLYASNPLYVYYPLTNSVEEPISLPNLPQFKGTTVYEVQQDIPPSGIEVCYYE